MKAATTSKRLKDKTKLLVLNEGDSVEHTTVDNFVNLLSAGDLIIINRSATLPSSFNGKLDRTAELMEIRLAAFQGANPSDLSLWQAFLFGEGNWRIPTEHRKNPPDVHIGDTITIGADLSLKIVECKLSRLISVKFMSSDLLHNLYKYGKPIQYSYLNEELKIWDQQTIFSGPPLSVEPPSASFPLTWELIFALQGKGVQIADLLHEAGISSTGQDSLDQLLPLTEWYDIPLRTVEKFNRAKKSKKRIVALGTSVLRALESAWDRRALRAGAALTSLKITPEYKIKTVDSLVTGMHEKGTSHMNILDSICPISQVERGYKEANALGYKSHEYGDLTFLNGKR
ncbi:MAG: S-adenosylmethionine:tRNA ribosyltransferase-isomerase [Bdellovibrionales bacterium]|nr:S-adenosylmethionine:tRNA ribosyltransferase-isomerase [Bdellovibrionales bacterium]